MTKRLKHAVLLIIFLVIGSACRRLPPEMGLPSAIDPPYQAVQNAMWDTEGEFSHADSTSTLPEDWWSLFADEQLETLIETALCQNPTLQIAEDKIFKAHYEAEKVCAALLPTVTLTGEIQRTKISQTGVIPATPVFPLSPVPNVGVPFYFTNYEADLNFAYYLDIWKKRRNALQAALGEVQARIADEAFVRLTLSTSVAATYFQLQVDYQRLDIAKRLLENRERNLDLLSQRLNHNLENAININTAEDQVSSARQALLQIEAAQALHQHQLQAYLANEFTEQFAVKPLDDYRELCVPFPSEIPLNLAAHRPDLTAQLWLIESSGYHIDIARAGYYPDINLMGMAGLDTIHIEKFFQGKSFEGFIGPALSLPIFDGGYIKANWRQKEVDYSLAVHEYDQLVVNAVREILDSLTNLRYAHLLLGQASKDKSFQENNYQFASQRAANGLDSDLKVLEEEQKWLTAKDREAAAFGRELQALVMLIRALGGGYDTMEACHDCS